MMATVLLDLDGVLVDFVGGICRAHGRDGYTPQCWDFYRSEWEMADAEFWKPTMQPAFWSQLDWTPDGRRIFNRCVQAVGWHSVYLLTSGRSAAAAAGKTTWVEREVGRDWLDRLLIGHCKHLCAHSSHILVDDYDRNVKAFRAAGGRSVLVAQPWNANRHLADARYETFDRDLDRELNAIRLAIP